LIDEWWWRLNWWQGGLGLLWLKEGKRQVFFAFLFLFFFFLSLSLFLFAHLFHFSHFISFFPKNFSFLSFTKRFFLFFFLFLLHISLSPSLYACVCFFNFLPLPLFLYCFILSTIHTWYSFFILYSLLYYHFKFLEEGVYNVYVSHISPL